MAKYGRGLICLALDEDRVEKLNLPFMSQNNKSRHGTAFTVSIEAKEGITTGISAYDRAKTISDAIDPNKNHSDIVSPGHIFPLKAHKGGVLVRAGHTEAAVDIASLAGLNPSGVICEIMNDDGSMARMNDLVKFSKTHNLKIATIADLIEYRRYYDKLIKKTIETQIDSEVGGKFKAIIYQSTIDNVEHLALVKGDIASQEEVLVRMHHLNIFSDVLGDKKDKKSGILQKAMNKISQEGCGIIVIIRQTNESVANLIDQSLNKSKSELRNYGIGAQILLDLGVKNMRILSNNQKSVIGLEGYGLKICGYESL
jgi:3,4-dihydroxy 2-butanone 4-phosphate synthase/GTP cyclohydrolase II